MSKVYQELNFHEILTLIFIVDQKQTFLFTVNSLSAVVFLVFRFTLYLYCLSFIFIVYLISCLQYCPQPHLKHFIVHDACYFAQMTNKVELELLVRAEFQGNKESKREEANKLVVLYHLVLYNSALLENELLLKKMQQSLQSVIMNRLWLKSLT